MLSDQSRPLSGIHSPTRLQKGLKAKAGPRFIFVNGRTPDGRSLCGSCCEPIGDTYVRDISTGHIYCNRNCSPRRSRMLELASQFRAWVTS